MIYNKKDIYIGRSFDAYGEFSEEEVTLFRCVLRLGMIVLDIGANIGAHTLPLAKLVGESGLVLAFEPQRILFQTLAGNMAINSITNVHCFQKAVGKKRGTGYIPEMYYNEYNNFGGIGLTDKGVPVEIISVDDLNLRDCHFMKIDVEGMELDVLEGAQNTIKSFKPVIYAENDRNENSDMIFQYLDSLGYSMYWHLPPFFNPDNFAGNSTNIFGKLSSKNIICLPHGYPINFQGLKSIELPQK